MIVRRNGLDPLRPLRQALGFDMSLGRDLNNRMRKLAVAGFTAVAGLVAVASLAWACTAPVGSTWYSDGTQHKEGRPGTVVRVYATGGFQGVAYTLVLGANDHGGHACMDTVDVLNNATRFANSSGFISTTVGTIHLTVPGTYQVCFKDNGPNNSTGTPGATFTIL